MSLKKKSSTARSCLACHCVSRLAKKILPRLARKSNEPICVEKVESVEETISERLESFREDENWKGKQQQPTNQPTSQPTSQPTKQTNNNKKKRLPNIFFSGSVVWDLLSSFAALRQGALIAIDPVTNPADYWTGRGWNVEAMAGNCEHIVSTGPLRLSKLTALDTETPTSQAITDDSRLASWPSARPERWRFFGTGICCAHLAEHDLKKCRDYGQRVAVEKLLRVAFLVTFVY